MASESPPNRAAWSDQQVDQWIGQLLRAGVILSAALVAAGGAWYLAENAQAVAEHGEFHGEPESRRDIRAIFGALRHPSSLDLIQFGLLTLILTPIARVAFTVAAFIVARDYVFVGLTLLVLAILLSSLFGAALLPG